MNISSCILHMQQKIILKEYFFLHITNAAKKKNNISWHSDELEFLTQKDNLNVLDLLVTSPGHKNVEAGKISLWATLMEDVFCLESPNLKSCINF